MSSNGDMVLGGLTKHLLHLHAASDELADKLGKVKTAAISAIGAFAGFEALRGIWSTTHAPTSASWAMDREL